MRPLRFCVRLFALLTLFSTLAASASALAPDPAEAPDRNDASIRAVLTKQADDWNAGNLDSFVTGYKNSPDILFIGNTVRRGYDQMVASYRKGYGTRDAMGALTFSNVEVHQLDTRFAIVLGNFHLERTAAGGGNADGIYSLVMEKTPQGWKIILDHTGTTPPAKPGATTP